jgi:hypothetical protein
MRPSREHVESICSTIRELLEQDGVELETSIEQGMLSRENWNSGLMERAPNGTCTLRLTIRLNGGAQETTGPPIGAPEGYP